MTRTAQRTRLLAIAAASACYYTPLPSEPVPAVSPEVAIEQFVGLLRSARRQAGCPELVWDARAASVARAHSADMQRRGYFSHETPEGAGLAERLAAAGIRFSAAAENIARGAWNGGAAYRQWIGSARHRRNLLNCRYTRHGVGVADGIWTHVLFAP